MSQEFIDAFCRHCAPKARTPTVLETFQPLFADNEALVERARQEAVRKPQDSTTVAPRDATEDVRSAELGARPSEECVLERLEPFQPQPAPAVRAASRERPRCQSSGRQRRPSVYDKPQRRPKGGLPSQDLAEDCLAGHQLIRGGAETAGNCLRCGKQYMIVRVPRRLWVR
ncbi:hypothetical protein N9L68_00710 [bacterium]|nr:hypothetical protein [bacterium]